MSPQRSSKKGALRTKLDLRGKMAIMTICLAHVPNAKRDTAVARLESIKRMINEISDITVQGNVATVRFNLRSKLRSPSAKRHRDEVTRLTTQLIRERLNPLLSAPMSLPDEAPRFVQQVISPQSRRRAALI